MDLHCGYHPHLNCDFLRLLLTIPCTGFGHSLTQVYSIRLLAYVPARSNALLISAEKSQSRLLKDVFWECCNLVYTGCGYNLCYGHEHLKAHIDQDCLCACFIRDVRLFPKLNVHLNDEVLFMCSN